jgi:hypothetical protein
VKNQEISEQERRNLDNDPCYVRVHVLVPRTLADHERESGLTVEGEKVLARAVESEGFQLDDGPHYVGHIGRESPRSKVGH